MVYTHQYLNIKHAPHAAMLSVYNNLKLGNKILLPTILAIGGIMALFATHLVGELEKQEKSRLSIKADRVTSLLSLSIAESLWNYDASSIQRIAEAFFADKDIIEVVVLDADQKPLITLRESGNRDNQRNNQRNNQEGNQDIHDVSRTESITDRETLIGEVRVVLTSHYIDEALSQLGTRLFYLVLLIASVLTLLISVISKLTLKPLTHVLSGIKQLSKGNYQYCVKVNTKDELGQVADQFNSMSTKITALRQAAVSAAEINKEMQIATKIQTALQPSPSALAQKNYEIAAKMEPAEKVGGDYYDCLQDADGRLWFGIGDVTGHGLISGLIMMMTQVAANTMLKNTVNMTPAELLMAINKVIHSNMKHGLNSNHHMTISFLVEASEGVFNYAGAHESILIYRANTGDVEIIDTKGMWLGIIPDIEKQTLKGTGSFSLQKEDICLIYTDGVIEIMNQQREQYDIGRLTGFLKRYAYNTNMDELVELLYQELMNFKHQQLDDITYLFFKKR